MSIKQGLYVTGGANGNIYVMDHVTGSVSPAVTVNSDLIDIAFYGDTLYGITANQLLTVDLENASCNIVGSLGFEDNAAKLGVATNGVIYCIATASGSATGLYTINPATGASTLIGALAPSPAAIDVPSLGMTFDTNHNLFGTTTSYSVTGQPSVSLMTVNLGTGQMTPLGGSIGFDSLAGMSFYGDSLYGVTADGDLISINVATGAGSSIGAYNSQNLDLRGMTAYRFGL